jgi:hypothetical protein
MIIGLTGLKQSGKSTASAYLQQKYGFVNLNFKTAMIEEIKRLFPLFLDKEAEIHRCTVDDLFNLKPGSFRQFMQNYGTELRRDSDTNYWVNKWLTSANKLWYTGQSKIVVDDVRFLNEAEAIKIAGGKIIRIIRKGQVTPDNHTSETEMASIKVDATIEVGEGEIDLLCQKINEVYDELS